MVLQFAIDNICEIKFVHNIFTYNLKKTKSHNHTVVVSWIIKLYITLQDDYPDANQMSLPMVNHHLEVDFPAKRNMRSDVWICRIMDCWVNPWLI